MHSYLPTDFKSQGRQGQAWNADGSLVRKTKETFEEEERCLLLLLSFK